MLAILLSSHQILTISCQHHQYHIQSPPPTEYVTLNTQSTVVIFRLFILHTLIIHIIFQFLQKALAKSDTMSPWIHLQTASALTKTVLKWLLLDEVVNIVKEIQAMLKLCYVLNFCCKGIYVRK